jgi:hypothetical protein
VRILTAILTAVLAASAVLGFRILATDSWLWEAAPTHAYGLIAFVALDIGLALAVLRRVIFSATAAALAGTIQFGAMLLDMLSGGPAGVSSTSFSRYLINDTAYVSLLVIQVSLVLVALATMATQLDSWHPHLAIRLRLNRRST